MCILSSVLCKNRVFAFMKFFPQTTAKLHHSGGRGSLFTPQVEEAICTMVRANNAIRLREIQSAIIEDNNVFQNIQSVSISTIERVLKRHHMSMKQLYRVSFERNDDGVKELQYQYIQVKYLCTYSNIL